MTHHLALSAQGLASYNDGRIKKLFCVLLVCSSDGDVIDKMPFGTSGNNELPLRFNEENISVSENNTRRVPWRCFLCSMAAGLMAPTECALLHVARGRRERLAARPQPAAGKVSPVAQSRVGLPPHPHFSFSIGENV